MYLFFTSSFLACFDKPQDTNDTADTADIIDSGDTSTDNSDFAGRSFILIDADGYTTVSEEIRLSFSSDTTFEYSGDCNSFFGDFTVNDSTFVSSSVGGTEIGCSTELMNEDVWLTTFFTSSPTFLFDGDNLVFQSSEVTLTFRDRAIEIPDLPLEDTTWTIDGYIEGPIASAYNLTNVPSVVFYTDGSISLDTGCNSGMGQYTLEGETMSVTMEAYSDAICPDDMSQTAESHITRVFMGPTLTVSVNEDSLLIMNDDLGVSAFAE